MDAITQVLNAIEKGDPHAAGQLLPLVYDELRSVEAQRLAQEKPCQTLQSTALVHEAYLRLVGTGDDRSWRGRGHFFAAAARALPRILVDKARAKQALKRDGGQALPICEAELVAAETGPDLLVLDEALHRLELDDMQA